MEVEYLDHADDGLKDRKIPKLLIEESLLNPDEIIEGKKGRKIAHQIVGNKLLRIIFEVHEKAYKVVTAYYTTPRRYLKK